MTLSEYSIKHPVFAWVLMFALIFFGALSFTRMGINENPDVDFPTVTVRYSYEGATAAVVEKDVIEPVESVLVTMEGIRNMTSIAERGSARVTLEFELDRNIDFALQEVQTLLGRAQRQLPETLDPPVVTKSNADDDPIVYAAVVSENLDTRELMVLFRDRILDRLTTVEGVAEVNAFGFHEPVLRIDLDAQKLRHYQLTAQDIIQSIQREHSELPAGKFEYGENESLIRIMGEASQLEEFQNMIISRRGGQPNYIPIRLKDVANVYEGLEPLSRYSRFNGVPSLGVAVRKQTGVNAVATADLVKERFKDINKDLPDGTRLEVNFDRTGFIRESVNELVFTLLLAALLTSVVCWIFLGSFSATTNILLAIPTSIVGTFIFINWMGFTLNTFSLLGLALAIGLVVDDAIVMLENIVRYVQKGFDRVNAAFRGSREIMFAVLATTFALVSIFIPIAFMRGIEGRFFFEFAVTLSIAVGLSSLEALTLAPMRCSQFLNIKPRITAFGRGFERTIEYLRETYRGVLRFALQHRWWFVTGSALLFVISLFTIRFLDMEFVPAQDRGSMFVMFTAPDGKSLQYTDEKIREFEKIAMAHPDVERTTTSVGGFGAGQGNRGNGVIILKPLDERTKTQFEIANDLRQQARSIEGLNVFIRDRGGSAIGGRRGSGVEFTLSGPDPKKQRELFAVMKEEMEKTGLMVGVRSDDTTTLPEIQLVPNRKRALERGVEVAEISSIINTTLGGVTPAQYTQGSRRFDIYVRLQEKDRQQVADLKPLFVRNNRGEMIPLLEVVDVVETASPQYIYREDRIQGIRVDAELTPNATVGEAVAALNEIADRVLPERYFLRFSETPQDKLLEIVLVMVLGLIIAYMLLAVQFNSFVDPMIVFLSIPFGISGACLALLFGGLTLNVYSMIGILLTMGIVKKNAILLVEFTNQLRDRGQSLNEALMEACPIRFRPILMTNTATIAAAIPAALALGPGAETRIPMALTVIGGVTVSAFFTLFVVPCVYSLIAPKRRKILIEDPDVEPTQSESVPTRSQASASPL